MGLSFEGQQNCIWEEGQEGESSKQKEQDQRNNYRSMRYSQEKDSPEGKKYEPHYDFPLLRMLQWFLIKTKIKCKLLSRHCMIWRPPASQVSPPISFFIFHLIPPLTFYFLGHTKLFPLEASVLPFSSNWNALSSPYLCSVGSLYHSSSVQVLTSYRSLP